MFWVTSFVRDMVLGVSDFEKAEKVKIVEEIYSLNARKRELECELSSEQFHYSYISKRRDITRHEVVFRLLFIVPLTILIISAISLMLYYAVNPEEIDGMSFLAAFSVLTIGGYIDVKLLIREFRMLLLLRMSLHPEKANTYSRKYGIHSFEEEELISKKRIESLEGKCKEIQDKLTLLEREQNNLFEQSDMNDNMLLQEESCSGDTSSVAGSKGKLFLRKNDDVIDNQQDYLDALLSDKKNFEERMVSLEEKLQELNNQRDTIYSDFEHAKKSLLYFLIAYVLVVLVQGGFGGIVAIILRLLCIVVTIYFILYFRNKLTPIIINYLVEKESDLIQEYAFCNNMTPIRMKSEDIKREKDNIQLELEKIERNIKLVSRENCD